MGRRTAKISVACITFVSLTNIGSIFAPQISLLLQLQPTNHPSMVARGLTRAESNMILLSAKCCPQRIIYRSTASVYTWRIVEEDRVWMWRRLMAKTRYIILVRNVSISRQRCKCQISLIGYINTFHAQFVIVAGHGGRWCRWLIRPTAAAADDDDEWPKSIPGLTGRMAKGCETIIGFPILSIALGTSAVCRSLAATHWMAWEALCVLRY